jgi:hypothetical protein
VFYLRFIFEYIHLYIFERNHWAIMPPINICPIIYSLGKSPLVYGVVNIAGMRVLLILESVKRIEGLGEHYRETLVIRWSAIDFYCGAHQENQRKIGPFLANMYIFNLALFPTIREEIAKASSAR